MMNKVNKPSHYVGTNGMEVEQFLKEFMTKENDGYVAHRKASAIEYVIRAFHKEDGIEDINKAIKNLELILEHKNKVDFEFETQPAEIVITGEWFDINGANRTDHLEKFKSRGVKQPKDNNVQTESTNFYSDGENIQKELIPFRAYLADHIEKIKSQLVPDKVVDDLLNLISGVKDD